MTNKTKIFSELSKIAAEAMNTFSSFKKEIETIVRLKVEKMINKMNLVRRDEFETLKNISPICQFNTFINPSALLGVADNPK